MNTVRRVLTIAVFAFFVTGMISQVYAQGQQRQRPQGQGQRPQMDVNAIVEAQMKWFEENFDLTEEQSKMIEEIHKEDVEKRKELMESGLTPRDEKFREQMDSMNIIKEAELEEVLTKEQWVKFEENKEEYVTIGRPTRPQRRGRN